MGDGQSRELAEWFSRQLRDAVLLLRQVSAEHPVTAQQLAVLGSLQDGPRRMGALAAEHAVRMPTMTVLINRLVRDGQVARGADASDARVVTVSLTPRGVRDLHTARGRRLDYLTKRFAALTSEERSAVAAALPALDKLFVTPEEEAG